MNLGLYEIMDRISTVQVLVEDAISNHEESDYFLKQILVEVQHSLHKAYTYSAEKYDDSCNDGEIQ